MSFPFLPEMLLPKPSSTDLQSHFPLPWYYTLLRNEFQRKQKQNRNSLQTKPKMKERCPLPDKQLKIVVMHKLNEIQENSVQ